MSTRYQITRRKMKLTTIQQKSVSASRVCPESLDGWIVAWALRRLSSVILVSVVDGRWLVQILVLTVAARRRPDRAVFDALARECEERVDGHSAATVAPSKENTAEDQRQENHYEQRNTKSDCETNYHAWTVISCWYTRTALFAQSCLRASCSIYTTCVPGPWTRVLWNEL